MSQNITTDPSVLDPDYLSQTSSQISTVLSEVDSSGVDSSGVDSSVDTLDSASDRASIAVQPPSFSVNTYAERLLDELFEEVEGMLSRGAKAPTEPAKPEFISLQSLTIPKMVLPSLVPTHSRLEELPEPDLDSLALAIATEPASYRSNAAKSVDRVLLIAAGASLIATAVLWFAFQNRWQAANLPPQDPQYHGSPTSAADTVFLQYMQRSLDVIERRAETNPQIASATTTPSQTAPTLPPVSVPGNPLPAGVSSGVPERVYIPVYQPPQASALPGVAIAPLSPNATAPSTTTPAQAAAVPTARAIPNISGSGANHVLVGLLELGGDRSAALFEVNGTTQRIHVGESVGSSGWTLVSVNNGEAVVRRNGEVRSIFVGQQF